MAHVADHLSVSALEQQYRSCTDVTAARHVQTIWLLAKAHTIAEVAATVSFARRWVERLLARYNAQGPQALGDLRCRNGTSPSVLRPALLEKLKARLREPPPDGGLWTSPKVAVWMASELGLAAVLPQRGWEALKAIGWSVQKPRPRHPASATPEERAKHPDKAIEVWATDEHRIGLKPIIRRVWAPKGQRPIALGHHRYKWLYVTAFVQPISGEVFWRGVLVCVERHLQAVLCRAAGAVCARGRGGTRADHCVGARQRRLAHRTEPGRAGWDPAGLPAPILARASARRAPLARPG
jgi:transposase